MAPPDLNVGPTGPASAIPTSRALTRVTPVAPRPVTPPEGAPLGRSGLDLRSLLAEPDQLAVRSRTPAIALDVGLEQARGALVRNQPADALMMLDAVWEGASKLETGWYLRGSSLTLLGLPQEAERIAQHALELAPNSVAVCFLQSVARLALGDVAGARQALAQGGVARGRNVLLLVQDALLIARSGDRLGAERALRQAIVTAPDDPAIAYGRAMLRQALREGERVFEESDSLVAWMRTPIRSATPIDSRAVNDEPTQAITDAPSIDTGDFLNDPISRIGKRLSSLAVPQATAECRALLASLSAGGALVASVPSARAHAARLVLGAIIDALQQPGTRGQGWEAASVDGQWQHTPVAAESGDPTADVLQTTVRALVALLRDGRVMEADQLLRRAPGSVNAQSLSLLRVLAVGERTARTPLGNDAMGGDAVNGNTFHVRELETGASALAPLRLGLSLLPPNEVANMKAQLIVTDVTDGRSGAVYAGDANGGWGVAQWAPGSHPRGVGLPTAGLAATLLAVLGVAAFVASHALIAIALGAASVWLAVAGRRKPRPDGSAGTL